MRRDVGDDVKIARRGALQPGVAFAADDNAGACVNARRNAHLDGFVFGQRATTVATRTWRAALPCSATPGAALIESQKSPTRGNLSRSTAGRARNRSCRRLAQSPTTRASLASPHVNVGRHAVNRVFETERERDFNVRAAIRLRLRLARSALRAATE